MSGVLRFLAAGESHGEALGAVIDGVRAGLPHVGEVTMAIVPAGACFEKVGGDRLEEIRRNDDTYLASLKTW